MISRRLLRIKILQSVYSYRKSEAQNFVTSYKEFEHSITKSYELYLALLLFLTELKHFSLIRIDQIKNRVIKDENEWNRLVRFSENKVFVQLEQNPQFQTLIKNHKISWANQSVLIKEIFNQIIQSDIYASYLEDEDSYAADNKFVRRILHDIILQSEPMFQYIEETSIYWNDEVDYIISIVEKTIKQFKESKVSGGEIYPVMKDDEVKNFAKSLFTETINKWSDYNIYIDAKLKNWEQERVAEIDVILLQIAITEAILFSEIPLKATLNEYIELAKWYSTDKSNIFVNGILHSIFETLQSQKVIIKKGRGLIS
jgi:transcription antitermination protein NusB